MESENVSNAQQPSTGATKFCKHCGASIPIDAVICTKCGRQVESTQSQQAAQPQIVINNTNTNTNQNINGGFGMGTPKNKWVALLLCIFGGFLGLHKFYEGRILTGILYFFTAGLFFIGVIIDILSLLGKPNPYYVR